jgi:hypothetical protein
MKSINNQQRHTPLLIIETDSVFAQEIDSKAEG